jgi:hypothetical protein
MAKKQTKGKDARTGTLWEPVDATPEQIALACMKGPPKKEWEYLKKGKKTQSTET